MTNSTRWLSRNLLSLTIFGALAASIVPVTPVHAAEDEGLAQKVQSAATAADHEALAVQYDKDAADAKAKAAEHRKMAAAYKGEPAITGGKAAGASAMPQHCERLAKSYDEQAQMYTAMAAAERNLAKAGK